MDFEVVKKAIDISIQKSKSTGFCFYGGEPLLNFPLIKETIEYANDITQKTGHSFNYKLNTNGSLLNEEILKFLTDSGVGIGFSHDGTMQNFCRVFQNGGETFDLVNEKAKLLLKYQPRASVQTTVAPQAVSEFSQSVKLLYELGFCNILTTPAYGKKVKWDNKSLKKLKKEYEKIAMLYEEWFVDESQLYFAAFDTKIGSYIKNGQNPMHICHIGGGQYSVDTDGSIYPCTQFIGDPKYYLGSVFSGIDVNRQAELSNVHISPDSCEQCALKNRCVHTCGCMNITETGSVERVSPMQCEHERMLIDISDNLGERLYKNKNKLFTDRFY